MLIVIAGQGRADRAGGGQSRRTSGRSGARYLNVRDVLKYDRLVVTREAIAVIEELWALPEDEREPSAWKQARLAAARPQRGEGGLAWLSCAIEDVIRRPLITEKNTDPDGARTSTPSRSRPRPTRSRSRKRSRRPSTCAVKAVNTLNVKPKREVARAIRRGVAGSTVTSAAGRRRS